MSRILLAPAVLFLFAAALPADDGRFEKTVPFPRSGEARLDWTNQKCTVEGVVVRNYPDREDIEKARASDPGDTSWLWWEFSIDNRGPTECKLRLWVEVLDNGGQVLKASDRKASVDAFEDDEVRVSTRMKTLDAADAPKVRLRAEILPK
jgi:hypothetical protein